VAGHRRHRAQVPRFPEGRHLRLPQPAPAPAPPIEPGVRFSRTRLTDALHLRCSATRARQAQFGLGATTIPLSLTRPRQSATRYRQVPSITPGEPHPSHSAPGGRANWPPELAPAVLTVWLGLAMVMPFSFDLSVTQF
jgi:hypothetical protein